MLTRYCRIILSAVLLFGLSAVGEVFYTTIIPVNTNVTAEKLFTPDLPGMVEGQLVAAFAEKPDYKLLSRSLLDKITREKTLSTAEELQIQQFKAAGIIVSPTLYASADKKLFLEIEAIAAQNAQLLGRRTIPLDSGDKWPAALNDAVVSLCNEMPRVAERLHTQTLVEATVNVSGTISYSFWRIDLMQAGLERTISSIPGLLCIQPRKPAIIQEERLLRVMGLTEASEHGGNFVALKPTADCRVNISLQEFQPAGGEVNNIKVQAVIKVQVNVEVIEKQVSGTVGRFDGFQKEVLQKVVDSISQLRKNGSLRKSQLSQEQQNKLAAEMAAEEMQSLEYLVGKRNGKYLESEFRTEEQKAIIAQRALRAWNLDPLNEEAAFWACYYHRFLYPHAKENMANFVPEAYEATAKIGDEYIACFGETNPLHYYNFWLMRSSNHTASDKPLRVEGICCVWELKNMPLCRSNTHQFFFHAIASHLLRTPTPELDSEFAYWKDFYAKQYLPAYMIFKSKNYKAWGGIRCSWEQAQAVYYARRGDSKKVRELLQSLADKHPEYDKSVWEASYDFNIPKLLKMAGDVDWETWKPKFAEKLPEHTLQHALAYYVSRNNPTPPNDPTLFMPPPIKLPITKVNYFTDNESDMEYGRIQPVGIVCKNDMLFMAPLFLMQNDLGFDVKLYLASRKEITRQFGNPVINIHLVQIPFPEYPIPEKRKKRDYPFSPYYDVIDYLAEKDDNDNLVLWFATRCHGLVRIERSKTGKFTGRWFTVHDGLKDATSINGIERAKFDGKKGLLLMCHSQNEAFNKNELYFFEPDSTTWKLLGKCAENIRIAFENGQQTIFGTGRTLGKYSITSLCNMRPSGAATSKEMLLKNDMKTAKINDIPIRGYSIVVPSFDNRGFYAFEFNIFAYSFSRGISKPLISTLDECLRRLYAVEDHPGWAGIQGFTKIEAPIGYINGVVKINDYFCIAMHFAQENLRSRKDRIFLWQPSKYENPIKDDRWLGAFTWAGDAPIESMIADPEGWLWLAGRDTATSWIVDMRKGTQIAKERKQVWSSQQWLKMYEEGFKKDWRLWAKYLAGQGQADKSLGVIDEVIATAKKQNDSNLLIDAIMLKAAILSNNHATIKNALSLFREALSKTSDPAVQYLAKKDLGMLYYDLKDYKHAESFLSQIPDKVEIQYVTSGEAYKYSYLVDTPVGYYLKKSREKLRQNEPSVSNANKTQK